MPADDDHDDEEDAGDGDGDKEHNEGRHTRARSGKFYSIFGYVSESGIQSCEMSIILHGAKSLNEILPQEKRANSDNFGT